MYYLCVPLIVLIIMLCLLPKSGTRFFLSAKRHKLCHYIASCTFRSKKILHTSTHFYTLLHTSTYFYTLLHTSTYFYTLLHGGFWVSWGGRGGMLDMFFLRNVKNQFAIRFKIFFLFFSPFVYCVSLQLVLRNTSSTGVI